MPRLSELIRKPSISLEMSHLSTQVPYVFNSVQVAAVPRLETSKRQVPTLDVVEDKTSWSLAKQVDKELERLAMDGASDEPLSANALRAIALHLVQELQRSDQLVAQVFVALPLASPLVCNPMNVAVLATKLGMGLRYSSEDLTDLAMLSLVHDIGKLLLPKALVKKRKRLTSNEMHQLRTHPVIGKKIFKKLDERQWLAEVVAQVYERWDGQGYPKGLKGTAIHEYAQVIGLANRFETLINGDGLTAHEAMRQLLTREKTAFRGSLLKTLVQQISLFPVGTIVRLNTGEVGTVEQTNPQHPLRPILRMTPGGTRAASEVLTLKDLSQDKLVHITEIVNNLNKKHEKETD